MKTTILSLAFLLTISTWAQTIIIGKYQADQYINDISSPINCNAAYSVKSGLVFLGADGSSDKVFMVLDKSDREKISLLLRKFKEWAHIADSTKLEAEKTIGTITIQCGFSYGTTHFDFRTNTEFKFYSTPNEPSHMCIRIESMTASDNEYITCERKIIWLTEKGVDQLLKCIDEINIKNLAANQKQTDEKANDVLK